MLPPRIDLPAHFSKAPITPPPSAAFYHNSPFCFILGKCPVSLPIHVSMLTTSTRACAQGPGDSVSPIAVSSESTAGPGPLS